MKALVEFLVDHGATLLLGTTVLLSFALALVFVHKQPIHRQRIAESSMVLCVLFLILACIPLPRFSFEKKGPVAAVKMTPKYELQPGDEVIAAEVFRVPRAEKMTELSTGNAVALPTPPASVPSGRAPEVSRRNW